MIAVDVVYAEGHKNIKATHRTTLEVTVDNYLTPRGDCIIGIKATKSCAKLDDAVKNALKHDGIVCMVLATKNAIDLVVGISPKTVVSNERKIIARRSDYKCNATIAVKASKSAEGVSRGLINELSRTSSKLISVIIALKACSEERKRT